MKKITGFLILMLLAGPAAFAADWQASVRGGVIAEDHDRDAAWMGSLKIERRVYEGFFVGVEPVYQGRTYFDSVDDPKGSFGSLDAYGLFVDAVYRVEDFDARFKPYFIVGVGYMNWTFHENPFLQDNGVKVDTEPGFAAKIGAGFDYYFKDNFALNVEVFYFDAQVKHDTTDRAGQRWRILNDGDLGVEYWAILAGFTKKW